MLNNMPCTPESENENCVIRDNKKKFLSSKMEHQLEKFAVSQKRPCPPRLFLALIAQAGTIVVATCHVGLTAQKERREREGEREKRRELENETAFLSLSSPLLLLPCRKCFALRW